jgi:hypothetical protein
MAYIDEVLADTPLGYWRLGATPTTDSSGNSYTLTEVGTPTAAASLLLSDSADGCRDIDTPDTDYYELASGSPGADDFDYEGTASFSVECWINLDTTTADFERLVAHESSTNGWILYYNASAGIGIGRNRSGVFALKDEVPGTFTGQTHHVVGTYDGSQLLLYLDGSAVGSAVADSTAIAAYTATLRIGRSPLGGTTGMDGRIDEVAVYSSALSSARVSAHYSAGVATTGGPKLQTVVSPLRW